jgi:hypothetical protein
MELLRIGLKCVAAGALIATGTVLLVLPGPGIPLIIAGIAVLATEFAWAASLQDQLKALWQRMVRRVAPV